jgi:hypothetical protein
VGRVTPASDVADLPTLELGVAEFSALYLGGVRAKNLVGSGRAFENTATTATLVNRLLSCAMSPFLGIWY